MNDQEKSYQQLAEENRKLRERITVLEAKGVELKGDEWFRTFVEKSTDFIYVADAEGMVYFINRTHPQHTREDVIGRKIFDFASPENHEAIKNAMDEVFAGKSVSMFENCAVGPEDTVAHYLNRYVPIIRDGKIKLVIGVSTDITERKRAEEALRESEERYRNYIAHSPYGVFLSNEHGRYLDVNHAACRITGYSEGELLEMSVPDMLAEEGRSDGIKLFHTVAREGQAQGEIPFTHKSGEKRWWTVSVVTLSDARILGFSQDITERRIADDNLRVSEETNRSLIENSPDIITTLDLNGKLININHVAKGYKKEDVIGMNASAFVPNEHKQAHDNVFKNVVETDLPGTVEFSDRLDNHFLCRYFPYKQSHDAKLVMGITTDISERKQAEEKRLGLELQVQHSQKLESLGVLAGGIAHDFNNLLVGVLGNADLALLDLHSESPIRSYVQDIQKASVRLAELTREMLAYSGKGNFVIETINLSSLVEEMAHLLKSSTPKKVALKYDLSDISHTIKADANQIRQVVMNLITNAAESYGEESGIVSLSTYVIKTDSIALSEYLLSEELPGGDYVFLEVSDTGCGMDREACQKIFEPFFSTKFTGRGLGMASVLGIVRSHCGAIKVSSEPDQGTTVKILFPHEKIEFKEFPEISPGESRSFQGQGVVLLVDDEEEVLEIGKKMLERMGLTVMTAVDGMDAVQRVRKHANELVCVLLDLTMPRMDGLEALSDIRRIRTDLPVIMCSGYNLDEANNQFAGKGLSGFLQKPFRYQSLVEKLQEVLEQRSKKG